MSARDSSARALTWKKIAAFYALTLLFSSVFYALILRTGKLSGAEMFYVTGLMWCPALAGVATQRIFGGGLTAFGWQPGRARYYAAAYLLPMAYALPVYLLVWIGGLGGLDVAGFAARKAADFGWAGLPDAAVVAAYVVLAGSVGVIASLSRALGEEIGWRGFLVPELSKVTGLHGTALISGLMWALWHYPVLIFGDYNLGAPMVYSLGCFTVMVLGVSYLMAWLRLASGTLWTAALLHAVHNRYIQGVFTPLTTDTGPTNYLIDEFGIGLALTTVIAAGIVVYASQRKPA